MSIWLEIGRIAAGLNIALLLALGYVWLPNYRRHGATHTLALLVFAGFLFVQNLLWIYLYVFETRYVEWYVYADPDIQIGLTLLCVLETAALVFLTWITWR